MTTDPLTTVLEDSSIQFKDVLGTHTFENVLYTGPDSIGVINVLTEELPRDLDRSLQDALETARERSSKNDVPHVAKRSSRERAVEARDAYTTCVFYHFSIVGGLEWHDVFQAAWNDPEYSVKYETNYSTGTLTITVEQQN